MRDAEEALKGAGVQVVLVSFAGPALAQDWLAATGFAFPLLLDPERAAYAAFGLRRSVAAAWSLKAFAYYFRQMARGRRPMRVRQDPYQLGGDFLVDREGVVRGGRPSDDPIDRPSVAQMLRFRT